MRRVENAGTARRREVWIFAARKTVVAVAGEGERPPWPDSDELSLRMKMTLGPRGDISRRPIGCYIRALYFTVTTISPVGVLTLLGETTMGDLNSVIIRKAYEDFAIGSIPSVFAVFDAGITWHVPGHSPLSGDYTGHDQVGGFFQRTMELSGGAFSMDVHNVLAEDDLVVALVTVNAERNGLSASFPEIHVWQMKNGKATDFREYQGDEQREDQFWS